jgi:hypothetical protein
MNIKPVQKFFSNPDSRYAKYASDTVKAVIIQTGLKAVGRPAFIYADKEADENTKKYAATKELIYQGFCLFASVVALPLFKQGGFIFFKNVVFRNKPKLFGDGKFKEFGDLEKYLKKVKYVEGAEKYDVARGSAELSSLVGSVLTLAILAPQLSQYIVHPIMKAIGFEDKKPKKPDLNCNSCQKEPKK